MNWYRFTQLVSFLGDHAKHKMRCDFTMYIITTQILVTIKYILNVTCVRFSTGHSDKSSKYMF
jgi:hypothetical protein